VGLPRRALFCSSVARMEASFDAPETVVAVRR